MWEHSPRKQYKKVRLIRPMIYPPDNYGVVKDSVKPRQNKQNNPNQCFLP